MGTAQPSLTATTASSLLKGAQMPRRTCASASDPSNCFPSAFFWVAVKDLNLHYQNRELCQTMIFLSCGNVSSLAAIQSFAPASTEDPLHLQLMRSPGKSVLPRVPAALRSYLGPFLQIFRMLSVISIFRMLSVISHLHLVPHGEDSGRD